MSVFAGRRAAPVDAARISVISPWRSGVIWRIEEVWRFRSLLPYLWNEFVFRRYRRTYLGWFWIPLRPGLDIGMKALLFGGFLGVGSGDRPYFIFIAFASAGWVMFDQTLKWGTRSIQRGQSIVRGLHFPRTMLLFGSAAPAFFEFVLYSMIAVIGTVYYLVAQGQNYMAPPKQWLIGFLGLGILCFFGLCISLFTAPVAFITKEVRYGLGYFTQVLYFLTPVVYPISGIPPQYRPIAELNPVTGPIEMVKFGFLSTAPPATKSLISSFVVITVLFVGGLWFSSRFERKGVGRLRL